MNMQIGKQVSQVLGVVNVLAEGPLVEGLSWNLVTMLDGDRLQVQLLVDGPPGALGRTVVLKRVINSRDELRLALGELAVVLAQASVQLLEAS